MLQREYGKKLSQPSVSQPEDACSLKEMTLNKLKSLSENDNIMFAIKNSQIEQNIINSQIEESNEDDCNIFEEIKIKESNAEINSQRMEYEEKSDRSDAINSPLIDATEAEVIEIQARKRPHETTEIRVFDEQRTLKINPETNKNITALAIESDTDEDGIYLKIKIILRNNKMVVLKSLKLLKYPKYQF